MPKASLFSSATSRSNNNNNNTMGMNPNRMPRFETPGLTPIPASTSMMATAHTPHYHEMMGNQHNPKVVRRAQQVASRQYYQPSPETPHTAEIRTSLQYLQGLGRNNSSTANPPSTETPLRRGGGGGGSSKEAVEGLLSSAAPAPSLSRKPRALFLSSENKINNTPEPEEDGMDHDQAEDEKPAVEKEKESTMKDGNDESESVQSILELLCVLGSAWRRLCQV